MAFEVKLVIAGVLSTLLTLGGYEHLFNLEANRCEMTYMFQKPHFIVSICTCVYVRVCTWDNMGITLASSPEVNTYPNPNLTYPNPNLTYPNPNLT